jgi:hypothetical protein
MNRMQNRSLVISLLSLLLVLVFTVDSFACACCAEPGTRYSGVQRIDSFYLGLLDNIDFAKTAELYTTEAGFDTIVGLGSLRKEYESDSWTAESGSFGLNGVFSKKAWRLSFKTKNGTAGSLLLPMPAQMRILKVDTRDNSDTGNGPILYKEMVFEGRITTGTGFFRSGLSRPATYTLVFQGRGNGCDNATDYGHWNFEVNGPKAKYAFYGQTATTSIESAE